MSSPRTDGRLAERQDVLVPFAGEPGLHQARGPFRDDDLVVRRDVVAVGVGDEGERFRVPRIEPDVFVRQVNPALVLDRIIGGKLAASRGTRERLGAFLRDSCSMLSRLVIEHPVVRSRV